MVSESKIRDNANQERDILEHFIINESKNIEVHLRNKKLNGEDELSHFTTYPRKIEKEMGTNQQSPANFCKKYLKLGILEELDGKRTRGRPAKPYRLKSDLNTLRILVKLIIDSMPYPDALKLLDNYYFTYNINDSLIKEVLAEKNVTITRYFSTIDFDVNGAQRLYDRDHENSGYSEKKTNAAETMKEFVNKEEEKRKENERSSINNLTDFCNVFLEYVAKSNDDTEMQIQDFENWAVKLIERFKYFQNYTSIYVLSLLQDLRLKIPIFCDDTLDQDKINEIKKRNYEQFYYLFYGEGVISISLVVTRISSWNHEILEQLMNIERFLCLPPQTRLSYDYKIEIEKIEDKWMEYAKTGKNEYDSSLSTELLDEVNLPYPNLFDTLEKLLEEYERDYDLETMIRTIYQKHERIEQTIQKYADIKGLKNEFIENNFAALLKDHYEKYEYEKVIIPVLSLIHASPMALNDFLNGEWTSFDLFFTDRGDLENSQFLTRLIHIVTIDSLIYPKMPQNGIVQYISKEHVTYPEHSQMLSTYKPVIDSQDYNAIYDNLNNDWYNNMTYSEFENFEPSFLNIKLKQIYDLKYMLSFKPDSNSKLSIDSYAKISVRSELDLLKLTHIKDPLSLIDKLKSNDSKFAYIRSMFSTQMQNKVVFIDTNTKPSTTFLKELLQELNNVIMNPEFNKYKVFKDVLPENEDMKLVFHKYSTQNVSTRDILRMVNEQQLYHRHFLGVNRYLIEKLFENELESGYIAHYEKFLAVCVEDEKRKQMLKNNRTF